MAIRVGINGCGRIGRNLYGASSGDEDIHIVAVNDITSPATLTHLLKYDSVMGNLSSPVEHSDDSLSVDEKGIRVFSERDSAAIDWPRLDVDLVESTGLFTKGDDARKHLPGSVQKVIMSAPSKGEDITICVGVNHDKYDPASHHVISNASCTTNCLSPVAKVLHESFGIEGGLMTTVHALLHERSEAAGPGARHRRVVNDPDFDTAASVW